MFKRIFTNSQQSIRRPSFYALPALIGFILLTLGACVSTQIKATTPFGPAIVSTARVNGVDIGYRIVGQGPPLLMIMGYAGSMDVWDPVLIKELARTRKLIIFDNRGMGNSTANATPFSIRLFAQDTAGLLDILHIDRADIMGWSMGALIAVETALQRPDKVKNLVLYGASADNNQIKDSVQRLNAMDKTQFLNQLFPKTWLKINPDIFSRLPSSASKSDPVIIGRQAEALANWGGTLNKLENIRANVLLMVGEKDDITPPIQSLYMAEKIKGACLIRFRDAGHWMMYQYPLEIAGAAECFLSMQDSIANSGD